MVATFAHGTWRAATVVGAICALLATALGVAPPASAEHFEDVREINATEGIAAAVAYSKLTFPDGASSALLTRSNIFADSLASGSLQGTRPLLLTASNSLSTVTKAELERLGARTVTILGGTSAVSSRVADELEDEGYRVERISGGTRIETAVAVARSAVPPRVALLARAFGTEDPTSAFADALAAGGWAADTGWPVLLTETAQLSSPTADFLRSGVDQVWVIGGRAAVSDTVLSQVRALGVAANRISGPNRFETALAVAKQRGFNSGADARDIVLVDGQGEDAWKDGFAAAAFAGRNSAPVLLANSASTELPAPTLAFLEQAPAAKLLVGWTVPAAQTDTAAEAMGKEPGVTRIMTVAMTGRNVVRTATSGETPIWGHGESGKTGLLTMTVDDEKNTIDYEYESNATGPYIAATTSSSGLMIRRGAVDKRGDTVVRFPTPPSNGTMSGTVTSTGFAQGFSLRELIDAPTGFYAESYTNGKPSGAVRGQLPTGGESHLPGTPTFTAIETKELDSWITLKFAAPVFLRLGSTQPLTASDFAVTVRNGVAVQVQAPVVPGEASEATDSIVLKLVDGQPEPTQGTEVSVTLKGTGASKLANNLGATVGSGDVTQKHTTPDDSTPPVFTAVEASANSDIIKLVFSEPVHTDGQPVTTPNLTVTIDPPTGNNITATATLNVTRFNRNTRHSLSLTTGGNPQNVPAGSEVHVTFSGGLGGGADKVKDAAGIKLTAPLTRSGTASTTGGALVEATATDLVMGGRATPTPAIPTSNQSQTVTVKLQGAMPPSGSTPSEIKVTVPSTATYADRLPQTSGFPVGTTVTYNANVFTFALPTTAGIPDGTTLSMTFFAIEVPGASNTEATNGTGGTVTIRRTDTGHTTEAKFNRLRGVGVQSLTTDSTKQELQIQLRTPTGGTNNGSLSIDLSDMVARGIVYPAAGPCDRDPGNGYLSCVDGTSGAGANGTGSATFAGSPTNRLLVTPTNSNSWSANTLITITIPLATSVASSALPGARLGIERLESVPAAPAQHRVPFVATQDLDWNVSPANKTQQFTYFVQHPIATGADVVVELTRANPALSGTEPKYPASGVTNTYGTVSTQFTSPKWVLTFTATSDVPAGTLLPVSFAGVDIANTLAGDPIVAQVKRGFPASATVPFAITNAKASLLRNAVFTDAAGAGSGGAKTFGDDINDRIELTFTADAETTGALTLADVTGTTAPPIACTAGTIQCTTDPADQKKVIITVLQTMANPIELGTFKLVRSTTNGGTNAGVAPDYLVMKCGGTTPC